MADKMTESILLDKILEFLPNAEIGEDDDGQIIIYTNLIPGPNSEGGIDDDLVEMPLSPPVAIIQATRNNPIL